jgi:hypothetical protein
MRKTALALALTGAAGLTATALARARRRVIHLGPLLPGEEYGVLWKPHGSSLERAERVTDGSLGAALSAVRALHSIGHREARHIRLFTNREEPQR